MLEEEDYYIENGFYVFTEKYHLKRGYCCKSSCRHCPWNYAKNKLDSKKSTENKDKKDSENNI